MLAGNLDGLATGNEYRIRDAVDNISEEDTLILLTNSDELVEPTKGKTNTYFVKVPSGTMGALATLAFGLSQVPKNAPFIVLPSNSTIPSEELSKFEGEMIQSKTSVGAVVFEGDSPLYSYARLDTSGQIMEIVEKQVIGSCALAGVFFFKDKDLLANCIKWSMVNNAHTKGSFFVAPALNYFIAHMFGISLFWISSDKYVRL
jgi:hypothetical protein